MVVWGWEDIVFLVCIPLGMITKGHKETLEDDTTGYNDGFTGMIY